MGIVLESKSGGLKFGYDLDVGMRNFWAIPALMVGVDILDKETLWPILCCVCLQRPQLYPL